MTALIHKSGSTVPQDNHPYKVMAIYKFASLPDCETLKTPLAQFCCGRGIKGTLILAPEGINGTVAGSPEAIDALADYLFVSGPFGVRLEGAEVKYSFADTAPFLRMKVRLKPEIVTLRAPQVDPNRQVGTYVEPEDWNTLIERSIRATIMKSASALFSARSTRKRKPLSSSRTMSPRTSIPRGTRRSPCSALAASAAKRPRPIS
jgi:UPF0176 protein